MFKIIAIFVVVSAVFSTAPGAFATNGYFDIGYGAKSKGMGGAGVAFPQDALAPAINPAGISFIGNRADIGFQYFRPDRESSVGNYTFNANDAQNFFVPEAGVVFALSPRLTVGLALFGNGGMNTDYTAPIPSFGTTNPGIDLAQLFISPTISYKITDQHALGFSPILAWQHFRAQGLENFNIPDAGYDNSYGFGIRVGYTGQIAPWLTLGATYQSPIWMTRFKDYDNLFAEQGDFDIPQNFAIGIALKPTSTVTVAIDVQEILYSDIASIGNRSTQCSMAAGMGADAGPGFGWQDMTVLKIGVAWDVTPKLTLRAGYNYGKNPIPDDQTCFNMLAPGVVEHHLSAGFTYKLSSHCELSFYYMHAFEHTVDGDQSFSGSADLTMSQDAVGISLGWTF